MVLRAIAGEGGDIGDGAGLTPLASVGHWGLSCRRAAWEGHSFPWLPSPHGTTLTGVGVKSPPLPGRGHLVEAAAASV